MRSIYARDVSGETWWCNVHQRRAEFLMRANEHCCDPNLGGILLPCRAVNITGDIEIADE